MKKYTSVFFLSALGSLALLTSACSDGDSEVLGVISSAEPAGANCAQGGTKLEFGKKADSGTLDADEGIDTIYVCNGVASEVIQPGDKECPAGGVRIIPEQGEPTVVCAGQSGKDGEKGADGEPGAAGNDGADGTDGEKGADGEPGKDGADGEDGAAGKDGVDGKDGAAGKDGADGEKGEPGKDAEAPENAAWILVRDATEGEEKLECTNGTLIFEVVYQDQVIFGGFHSCKAASGSEDGDDNDGGESGDGSEGGDNDGGESGDGSEGGDNDGDEPGDGGDNDGGESGDGSEGGDNDGDEPGDGGDNDGDEPGDGGESGDDNDGGESGDGSEGGDNDGESGDDETAG